MYYEVSIAINNFQFLWHIVGSECGPNRKDFMFSFFFFFVCFPFVMIDYDTRNMALLNQIKVEPETRTQNATGIEMKNLFLLFISFFELIGCEYNTHGTWCRIVTVPSATILYTYRLSIFVFDEMNERSVSGNE